jgi:hypothetical protein
MFVDPSLRSQLFHRCRRTCISISISHSSCLPFTRSRCSVYIPSWPFRGNNNQVKMPEFHPNEGNFNSLKGKVVVLTGTYIHDGIPNQALAIKAYRSIRRRIWHRPRHNLPPPLRRRPYLRRRYRANPHRPLLAPRHVRIHNIHPLRRLLLRSHLRALPYCLRHARPRGPRHRLHWDPRAG